MARAKVLTPEAAGRELAKVLRLAAQKDEQLKDLVKERKGEIAALHKRARELQSIVLGDAVQVELDTTDEEAPPEAPPAQVAEVLGRKSKRRERQDAQAAALSEPCGACGVPADKPSADCEECDHPAGAYDADKAARLAANRNASERKKKKATDRLAELVAAAPEWLAKMVENPDAPRITEKWWPELVAGEPAHAPKGSRCPKNGIDWRGCATCSVQVASGRRPHGTPELPLTGGAT